MIWTTSRHFSFYFFLTSSLEDFFLVYIYLFVYLFIWRKGDNIYLAVLL